MRVSAFGRYAAAIFLTSLVLPSATRAASLCGGVELAVATPVGSNAPYVNLALEGKSGVFLLNPAQPVSSISKTAFSIPPMDVRSGRDGNFQTLSVPGLDLPGLREVPRRLRITDPPPPLPGGAHVLGVLGADVIEQTTIEFQYDRKAPPIVMVGGACDEGRLKEAGLHRIDQGGQWAGAARGVAGYSGPSAPFSFASKAGAASAWMRARFDLSYEGTLLPNTITINLPVLTALRSSGISPVEGPKIQVRRCDGSKRMWRTFSLPNVGLRLGAGRDQKLIDAAPVTLLLEKPDSCSDSLPKDEPAARLSASFMRTLGTTLFIGPTREVWIRPAS